jgi:transcriptional regulator with XRE-family HTH domain
MPSMGSAKALHTSRYRAFLARLRQARMDAGLTQEEIAGRLGRPQTWVSKCELGERRVDFVEIEDFAAACDKPLEFFRTRASGRGRR